MEHQRAAQSTQQVQPKTPASARYQTSLNRIVAHPLLKCQRTMVNQAEQQMLSAQVKMPEDTLTQLFRKPGVGHDFSQVPTHAPAAGVIQTKLTINQPGDEYEQEADHVAEKVMRMPEPKVQRACGCGGACSECQAEQQGQEHTHMQLKRVQSGDTSQAVAPSSVHEVLRSPGQPLDTATRGFMESRFGHDFSRVRVHSDAVAQQSARDVNARAYTAGQNLVFGAGQFAPGTHGGQMLLAHELTHVVQQSSRATTIQCAPVMGGGTVTLLSWLRGVPIISHIQGNIYEINLTGYGLTFVGPYNELVADIKARGLNLQAHHIVGGEFLKDVSTGFTYDNAPCVALDEKMHAIISDRITGEQREDFGGRQGETGTVELELPHDDSPHPPHHA